MASSAAGGGAVGRTGRSRVMAGTSNLVRVQAIHPPAQAMLRRCCRWSTCSVAGRPPDRPAEVLPGARNPFALLANRPHRSDTTGPGLRSARCPGGGGSGGAHRSSCSHHGRTRRRLRPRLGRTVTAGRFSCGSRWAAGCDSCRNRLRATLRQAVRPPFRWQGWSSPVRIGQCHGPLALELAGHQPPGVHLKLGQRPPGVV